LFYNEFPLYKLLFDFYNGFLSYAEDPDGNIKLGTQVSGMNLIIKFNKFPNIPTTMQIKVYIIVRPP